MSDIPPPEYPFDANVIKPPLGFPPPDTLSDVERDALSERLTAMAAELRTVLAELPTVLARLPALEAQHPTEVEQLRQYVSGVRHLADEMARFYSNSERPADVAAFIQESRHIR